MADEIDSANDKAQEFLDIALSLKRKAHRPEPVGSCLAPRCGEEFQSNEPARLFCNADCATSYARHTK